MNQYKCFICIIIALISCLSLNLISQINLEICINQSQNISQMGSALLLALSRLAMRILILIIMIYLLILFQDEKYVKMLLKIFPIIIYLTFLFFLYHNYPNLYISTSYQYYNSLLYANSLLYNLITTILIINLSYQHQPVQIYILL